MVHREPYRFRSAHRVADECDASKPEVVQDGANVIRKRWRLVAAHGSPRLTEPAPCNADDAVLRGEQRGEFVKRMRGTAEPRDEDDRLTPASPIEIVDGDAAARHGSFAVWRIIGGGRHTTSRPELSGRRAGRRRIQEKEGSSGGHASESQSHKT
jgi:hypothetical protein